jgi:hypothetical protein
MPVWIREICIFGHLIRFLFRKSAVILPRLEELLSVVPDSVFLLTHVSMVSHDYVSEAIHYCMIRGVHIPAASKTMIWCFCLPLSKRASVFGCPLCSQVIPVFFFAGARLQFFIQHD